MAQLYKMTLYVCDLEDNLSLGEIKTLIKQDALDGVSEIAAMDKDNIAYFEEMIDKAIAKKFGK